MKSSLVPGSGLSAGLLEHPPADRQDLTGLLSDRYEQLGGDDAACGMAPANQRLDPHDLLILELHHRLVDHEQLVCSQRLGEVHLQVYAISRRGVHRGLEQEIAVLAQGLGLGQREVGILQQVLGRRG